MLFLMSVGVAVFGSVYGYRWARGMMTRRLRYVDAVQSRVAPWVAGGIAGALVLPLGVFPIIGAVVGFGTALAVGLGVGFGVARASREMRLASYHLDGR